MLGLQLFGSKFVGENLVYPCLIENNDGYENSGYDKHDSKRVVRGSRALKGNAGTGVNGGDETWEHADDTEEGDGHDEEAA